MDSAFYRPRAPDHKEIAAGNPHRQLQIKKKNGGKKPGTPDTGAAAQDKDPVGFEKEVTGKVPTELAIGRQAA